MNLLFQCSKEFSHNEKRNRNLSDTEYMICSFLQNHPDCSQEDVASAMKIDKTTVAKALLTLEDKQCIQRLQDRSDRRIKRLRITETGLSRVSSLMNTHNEWLSEIMSCLTTDEQKQFEGYCERLLIAAEAFANKHKNGGDSHAK